MDRFFKIQFGLTLLAGVLLPVAAAGAQEKPADRDQILHVLNRITFGPRAGDVELVRKMGIHNYIEQQLHPETIDDSAVEQEIAQFDLLQMGPQEINQIYSEEKKSFNQKGPENRAANSPAAKPPENPAMGTTMSPTTNQPDMMAMVAATNETDVQTPAPILTPAQQKEKRDLANQVNGAFQYRAIATIGQLEQAKLVRAIDSQRQLQEVLVDFWGNHFNIDVKKGPDSIYKVIDDRDVIRPHIWGKFRDLLEASARSPAMLYYLDNVSSTASHTVTVEEQQKAEQARAQLLQTGVSPVGLPPLPVAGEKLSGLNENYARELMELHTLGVDGGYSQQDVEEVARCFTGWTITRGGTGAFAFHKKSHDDDAKVVLGHPIPAGGGIQDGETVLDILASQPSCARFISRELCQRFVADDPPSALVERIAGVFTSSGGDLRAVTEAILNSPEFLSPVTYGNKIKSPFEFAVSAVRASASTLVPKQAPPFDNIVPAMEAGGVLEHGDAADRLTRSPRQSLNWHIVELGQPLFACTPPTGYKEVSGAWMSPGSFIERLNFAVDLAAQRISDVSFDSSKILTGTDLDKPDAVLDRCVAVLLQNKVTESTRKVLKQATLAAPGDSQADQAARLTALIIGSPEFQKK